MNFTAETKAAGRDIRLPGKPQPLCIYSRMGGGRMRASAGRGMKVMAIHSPRRTAPVVRARLWNPELRHQPADRRHTLAARENIRRERPLADAQVIPQQALEHGAQVGRRLEVAVLEEVGFLDAGQSATTRPPLRAPPTSNATVPVP